MIYELEFTKAVLKKIDKLNPQIAEQLIRKLEAIFDNPKILRTNLVVRLIDILYKNMQLTKIIR